VVLEEGGRAQARFELPGARVRAGFSAAGEHLSDVEGVHLLRQDGTRAYFLAEPDGWVPMDDFEGPALLAVERTAPAGGSPAMRRRLHHVLALENGLGPAPERVELPESELIARPRGSSAWLDRPAVELLEISGRPVAPAGAPVSLWLEPTAADGVRVPHLPADALLALCLRAPDGRCVRREVRTDGRAHLELVLP
jgi:hypothetical protein